MSVTDEADYHSKRALCELNLGLTAEAIAAGRAHLKLASLHMARARELSSRPAQPLLRM